MDSTTHFILNNEEIITAEPPGTLLLDFLRVNKRFVGTKEGCKEGDCGACTVLIGEVVGDRVIYKPVTSCLVPLGELHGKHLVSIEGINTEALSPVQQAIVDEGATQCGFCTPGIVVSLTHYLMEKRSSITAEGVKAALSGHLCRCTGYHSLKQTANHLRKAVGRKTGIDNLVRQGVLPEYFKGIAERLKKIPKIKTGINGKRADVFIAGGSDIYLQKGEEIPDVRVSVLNLHSTLKGISQKNGAIHAGALTTFEEFANHPAVQKAIPGIKDYMFLIASLQIRNRATLGGNIINASPIGDMTILLLVLDSILVLQNGNRRREVPMREFYRGYKLLDKKRDEILTEIILPIPAGGAKINFEKVSRRKCLDIASVNSAIRIRLEGHTIREAHLSMGGVAPVPLYMKETSQFLTGKPLSSETVQDAMAIAQREISPIDDIRGSAAYKRLLVRQLMIAHFSKLFPKEISVRKFYEKQ